MFEPVKLKTGEVVWLRTGKGPYLGRHEIARIEFAKWDAKQTIRSEANVRGN